MEIKYKISSRILLLAMLGAIMTSTSYLIFVYDPLHLLIRKFAYLAPGSLFLKLWSAPPHEVFIDIYIFNVTNQDAFLDGSEKLRFQEVGPYVYQEMLYNSNATFNEDGTMTYFPRRHLKFRRDLSIGDPDTDRIVSPNIPLLGITASLQDASFFTNLAVANIAKFLDSKPFLNITITEYLWGYDDRLVTLANKAIPSWINFDRFGIMDRLMALDNATNEVTLNIDPEHTPSSPLLTEFEQTTKYHIHRWNGSPGLSHWGYVDTKDNETSDQNNRCNMVEGSFEGTAFPPELPKNGSYKLYRRAFCRPVPFDFDSEVSLHGHTGYKYKARADYLDSGDTNPDNACYCVKGKCLKKGLSSLSPCYYDIPIALSQPHFLDADPWFREQIDGMQPNETLHESSFVLHKDQAIPLKANLKIQIVLDVGQTRYNSVTRPFNGLVLPLFYLQLRIEESPTSVQVLLIVIYRVLPVLQEVFMYLLGLGGLAVMSGSALVILFFQKGQPNGRLSFKSEYSPIPILPLHSQLFKPEIRILK